MLLIWWGSGVIVGGIVGMQVLLEVERKGSSLVGYGISAVVKLLALFLFMSGTKFYEQVKPSNSPLPNVLRVFVAAVRKGYLQPPEDSNQLYEKPNEKGNTEFLPHTNRFRRFNDEDKKTDYRSSEAYPESASSDYSQDDEGESAFLREPLIKGHFGPGFHIAQQWAQQRTTFSGAGAKMEKLHVYSLPVGVKPSEQYAYASQLSNTRQQAETKIVDETSGESFDSSSVPSWDALTDAGLEAVADEYNAASALLRGGQWMCCRSKDYCLPVLHPCWMLKEIHRKSGVLLWIYNIEEVLIRGNAKGAFRKGRVV